MRKVYSREEAHKATLEYFNGDELATNVWIDKYALKNNGEYYEDTPDTMHRRLAKEFTRIEGKYPNPMSEEEIYQLLKGFKYLVPQGSPMAGIGNDFAKISLSNCFVIGGYPDSYGGILNADEEQSQLMKRRGGVGQDLSHLRPSGAKAGTVPLGENAGMSLYMERYSNSTREVQQDGRRGALMLSVSIKHPDAEKFIDKKMIEGSVTGANVSVKLTDEFMLACEEGRDFFQTFPIDYDIYDILVLEDHPVGSKGEFIDPDMALESLDYDTLYKGIIIDGTQTYFKKANPKKLLDKLTYNAWASAEPGALFWDTILRESPLRGYGEVWAEKSTNPCGEIPLCPYDSCRLLAINLMGYVFNPFGDNAMLEDTLLVDHVKKAQRLMDDIVDLEIEKIARIIEGVKSKKYPKKFQNVELELWEKIMERAVLARRTGLGITAEADLIAALGYKYGTPEASLFSEKLHQLIATASYESSIELAKERGAFPIWNFDKDSESDFIKRMFTSDNELITEKTWEDYVRHGRRNIANLTIAPAGSISILTQTTSGIEPLFSPYYFRKKKAGAGEKSDYVDDMGDLWIEFPIFHRPFIQWFSEVNDMSMQDSERFLIRLTKKEINKLFIVSPYFQATAQDVDYIEKIKMQGQVQKWVDHSISVTVNMPEDVTKETVAKIYKTAHESGCKGVTVYRDNSRGNVLSTTSIKDREDSFEYTNAKERPPSVTCDIFHRTKSGEDFIVLIGKINNKPYEVFAIPRNDNTKISKKIKTGNIVKQTMGEWVLYSEDSKEILIDSITSHMIESEQNSTRNFSAMLRHRMDPKFIVEMISKYASISSFHKVVGKVLSTYIEAPKGVNCPQDGCNGEMVMSEGCMKCPTCGYAKCG